MWTKPKTVIFGNGTKAISTYYVYLGPIMGNSALLKTLTNTILAVPRVNRRGYGVNYNANMTCDIVKGMEDKTVLLTVPLDTSSSLYYMNVCNFINFQAPPAADVSPLVTSATAVVLAAPLSSSPAVVTAARKTQQVSKTELAKALHFHDVMYHAAAPDVTARALRRGVCWPGVDVDPYVVEQLALHRDCLSCLLAKMNRLPRSLGSGITPALCTVVSADYKPITPTAIGGYVGFYLFVERTVTYKIVVLLKAPPTSDAFVAATRMVHGVFRTYGHTLQIVRPDAGTVEGSADAIQTLRDDLNLRVEPAAPEAQYQNDSERTMQTILKGVSSLFVTAVFLSNHFWALALLGFVNACNAVPNTQSGEYTPEYHVTGRHPDLHRRFKFAFGQPVASIILNQEKVQRKHTFTFTPSSEYGYAVGSVAHNGATLVYMPSFNKQRVQVRQDVKAIKILEPPARTRAAAEALQPVDNTDGSTTFPPFAAAPTQDLCPAPGAFSPVDTYTFGDLTTSEQSLWPAPQPVSASKGTASTSIMPPMDRPAPEDEPRSKRVRHPPAHLSAYEVPTRALPTVTATFGPSTDLPLAGSTMTDSVVVDEDCVMEVTQTGSDPGVETKDPDPWSLDDFIDITYVEQPCSYNMNTTAYCSTPSSPSISVAATAPATATASPSTAAPLDLDNPSLKEAQQSPEWDTVWRAACQDEMDNLYEHDVGDEVTFDQIPTSATIYPTKMHLHKKRDTSGVFTRAKARLVVIGNCFSTVYSLFAPTVNERSVKLIFFLSIIFGLMVTGVDVKGAFLYPEQKTDVYISLPSRMTEGSPRYWKLKKTLYGLSESPRAFYDDCSTLLMANGYTRTTSDPCMFHKHVGDKYIMIVVHVDDFVIASSDKKLTRDLLVLMRSRYQITVQASVEDYIGLNIEHMDDGSILLTQPHQIEMIARDYNLTTVKPPVVPMSSLFNDEYQDGAPKVDVERYMRLLGRLLFIIKTRPDIAYAVNRLATRSHCATERDFKALLRVASYLHGTRELGLKIKKSSPTDRAAAARLSCYVDAAYATHPDSKSHSGYCFSLGDTLAMFYSRTFKQTNVTLSSTEAENAAAVEATKEIVWFRALLEELGFPQLEPTLVYADNASMITLANDFSGNHKRVKHYMTRINYMIEQVKLQSIKFEHVSSEDNVADILTKPLGPTAFLRLRPRLMGYV